VGSGSNCVDTRSVKAEASCCGVNLAFAVFAVEILRLGPFPHAVELYPSRLSSFTHPVQVIPKMARDEYFRADPESNRVGTRFAEEETSCCGVNLAFAVLG
jgi:hypothetical protein